jgi:hypothetical protein
LKPEQDVVQLDRLAERLRPRLRTLYASQAEDCLTRMMQVCSRHADLRQRQPRPAWSQRDVVLVEMLDVLLSYIRRGARIVRLDAVAYLWKQAGTTCVHLPQTHTMVKLLRDVVDTLAPGTLLLTETNVPHAENASYWGDSDEAHLIYNFSLAPLLLDALLTGDAAFLHHWLSETPAPPPGAALLNSTASHDGIGVRPLESLLPADRVERLMEAVQARGGLVNRRSGPNGRESPYELNNLTSQTREIDLNRHSLAPCGDDLISGSLCSRQEGGASLTPYQVAWLPVQRSGAFRAFAYGTRVWPTSSKTD